MEQMVLLMVYFLRVENIGILTTRAYICRASAKGRLPVRVDKRQGLGISSRALAYCRAEPGSAGCRRLPLRYTPTHP